MAFVRLIKEDFTSLWKLLLKLVIGNVHSCRQLTLMTWCRGNVGGLEL